MLFEILKLIYIIVGAVLVLTVLNEISYNIDMKLKLSRKKSIAMILILLLFLPISLVIILLLLIGYFLLIVITKIMEEM